MGSEPWYRTTLRWGQTNLVEIDPARYDDGWWREHWRRTRVQGVIVNAGGIVAYYPSRFPLHHRAQSLGERDLYGEIVKAAREEGLKVIARMDSNRVAEDFYREHPDWICLDIEGNPYRQADKYVTCINSPYYSDYLPGIMREIIERTRPDGFADNSWAGIPRKNICYCRHCAEQFRAWAGVELPRRHDFADENYRRWIRWNYTRRTDLWEFNNKVTTEVGGKDCHWMGMISGDVLNNCNRFIDLPAILARSPIVMLDHQRRNGIDGFEDNTEVGKRLHEVGGWDKLIPESTPQYQLGSPAFRLASMPPVSPAASSPGGITSARCTRTAASTRPPSRSSNGTRPTRTSSSTASRRPMSASSGRRPTTTSTARTSRTTARRTRIAARQGPSTGPASPGFPCMPTTSAGRRAVSAC
jgi:hypothetical protein